MSHEGEFGLTTGFPAEVEQGQEIAELLAIEDHAIENTATKLYRAAMATSEKPSPALMVPISFSRLSGAGSVFCRVGAFCTRLLYLDVRLFGLYEDITV